MSPYPKIDCHSHYLPPEYREALLNNGYQNPDGMPGVPTWSEQDHLDMMSQVNVTKSILSISSPGTCLVPGNDKFSCTLSRQCNDYAADLKKRSPDKFGFWASLPMTTTKGALEEIAYALDTIDADGFTMETNYHGIYLGDKQFDAIFDELNRRRAKIFIHPTTPCVLSSSTNGGGPTPTNANPFQNYASPLMEFLFDTARTVTNLFVTGTVERCPDIQFIIPHVGGAFPPLINRIASIAPTLKLTSMDGPSFTEFLRDRLKKQFYFDTAGWAFPEQVIDILQYVPVDRLVYGSDFPWSPLQSVASLSDTLDKHLPSIFPDAEDREKLCSGNAKKLLEDP